MGQSQQRLNLYLTDASYERAQKEGITVMLRVPVTGRPAVAKAVAYDYGADLVGTNSINIR